MQINHYNSDKPAPMPYQYEQQYFYSNDGVEEFGPFSLEELKQQTIFETTKIWYEGLADWTPITELEELYKAVAPAPPPPRPKATTFSSETPPRSVADAPPTYLVMSILATLFCCLPLGIVGIINAAKVESRYYAGDIEGAYQASEQAKSWSYISIAVGFIAGVILISIR